MKPIVVMLHKNRKEGEGTKFRYPACWYGNEKRIQVLAYEDTGEVGSNVLERCIAVVPDDLFEEFKRDPEISFIDPDEANILIAEWRPPVTVINDRDSVLSALITEENSIRRESDRSKAMERILDPSDSTPGIVKKKSLDINDYLKEG